MNDRAIRGAASLDQPLFDLYPHSVQSEQAILGALLLDNTSREQIKDILCEDDFYSREHQTVYRHVVGLIAEHKAADVVTLAERLTGQKALEAVGGIDYLQSLRDACPSAVRIRDYAQIVLQKAKQRRLLEKLEDLSAEARAPDSDIGAIIRQARELDIYGTPDESQRLFPRFWLDETPETVESKSIIKGLVSAGDLLLIYGPSGDGKTFFTIDALCYAASGLEWRGRKVNPVLVVYVAAEAGARIARRFMAWRDWHIGDEREERIPLSVVTRGANLLDEGEVEELLQALRGIVEEVGLDLGIVAFDTLSRSMPGGEENGAEAMSHVIGVADRIRDAFGAAVVLVHHTGKETSKGARGHSSLHAAADTVISVMDRVATIEKSRDGKTGEQFAFDLEVVELGKDADGDPLSTCIVRPADTSAKPTAPRLSNNEKVAMDVLREAIKQSGEDLPATSTLPRTKGVQVEAWREAFYRRSGEKVDRKNGPEVKAFQRAREGLLAKRTIGIQAPWAWVW